MRGGFDEIEETISWVLIRMSPAKGVKWDLPSGISTQCDGKWQFDRILDAISLLNIVIFHRKLSNY